MTNRLSKVFMCVLLAAAMIFAAAAVYADSDQVDLSRNGSSSIRVLLQDKSTGGAIGGGVLEILQVADLSTEGGYAFQPTGGFNNSDFSFDLSADANLSDPSLAANLAVYAANHNVTGVRTQVSKYGRAEFTGLDLGVYLIIEREAAEGYQTAKPFLVTIPFKEGDTYIYDVDATPKVGSISPLEPLTEVTPEVSKIVSGVPSSKSKASSISQEYVSISVFEFVFSALDPSYPMPTNSTGSIEVGGHVVSQTESEMVIQMEGPGSLEIGTIEFTKEGDYYYTVTESFTGGNYDYDSTKYFLKYSVKRVGDELVVAEKTIRVGSANGNVVSDSSFKFSNRYRKGLRVDEEEEIEAHKTMLKLIEEENGENNKTTVDVPDDSEDDTPKKTTVKYKGEEPNVVTRVGNKDVEEEGNPPDRTTTRVNLPQTGQLWWPVWLLAGAGALFLLIGFIRRKMSH